MLALLKRNNKRHVQRFCIDRFNERRKCKANSFRKQLGQSRVTLCDGQSKRFLNQTVSNCCYFHQTRHCGDMWRKEAVPTMGRWKLSEWKNSDSIFADFHQLLNSTLAWCSCFEGFFVLSHRAFQRPAFPKIKRTSCTALSSQQHPRRHSEGPHDRCHDRAFDEVFEFFLQN